MTRVAASPHDGVGHAEFTKPINSELGEGGSHTSTLMSGIDSHQLDLSKTRLTVDGQNNEPHNISSTTATQVSLSWSEHASRMYAD